MVGLDNDMPLAVSLRLNRRAVPRHETWIRFHAMEAITRDLRYLTAAQLRTVSDELKSTVLLNPDNRKLGRLAGALVDPLRRRVRYLIVESRDWLKLHRYVIPLGITRF